MKIINNLPKLTNMGDIENSIQNLESSKAPKSHASSIATTYGAGTSTNFGHVKLSDSYTSSAGVADSGIGASSKAVCDAYTSLNTYITQNMNFYNNLITAYKSSNLVPSWYMSNQAQRVVHEFKYSSTVGISSSDYLGMLETVVPWPDASGGLPTQTFYLNVNGGVKIIYHRFATSTTEWSDWGIAHRDTYNTSRVDMEEILSGTYYTTTYVRYLVRNGSCYVDFRVTTNTPSTTWVKITNYGLPIPASADLEFTVGSHSHNDNSTIIVKPDAVGNLCVAFGVSGLTYIGSISYPIV